MNKVVVLAFFVGFLGLPYHLATDITYERGSGMTNLLTSLGCSQVARMASWLAGPPLAYAPAYLLMGMLMKIKLWTRTSAAVPLLGFLLEGLAMAAFVLFLSSFFRQSTRSAIVVTIITIILGVLALISFSVGDIASGPRVFLGFLFPPMSLVYLFISVDLWEIADRAADVTKRPPADGKPWSAAAPALAIILVTLASTILYFFLAMLVERIQFYPDSVHYWLWPWSKPHTDADNKVIDSDAAISLSHVRKQFGKDVAIDDCTMTVAKSGITYLLGRNGSGKTTCISLVCGLASPTSGEVRCLGMRPSQLPPGTVGLCPQQNVFWPDLSVIEHLWLFDWLKSGPPPSALGVLSVLWPHQKGSSAWIKGQRGQVEIERLLYGCGLRHKADARPTQLSGGQQRKLCLANSLTGSSPIVVVDEACSGLDPVSRRAIWSILLRERHSRTILCTTHFLDEADYLADEVIILGAPGRLLARGSPVQLRSSLGNGVLVHASLAPHTDRAEVWRKILEIYPAASALEPLGANDESLNLVVPSQERALVVKLLDALEKAKQAGRVLDYNGSGATMEEVFVKLSRDTTDDPVLMASSTDTKSFEDKDGDSGKATPEPKEASIDPPVLSPTEIPEDKFLSNGQQQNFLFLTWAQFLKRCQLARHSWSGALLAIIISVAGSAAVLTFTKNRNASCARGYVEYQEVVSLNTVPKNVSVYPNSLASTLDTLYFSSRFIGVPSSNFSSTYTEDDPWQQMQTGSIVLDPSSTPTFAWLSDREAGVAGMELLSVANNQLMARYAEGRNITAPQIHFSYEPMASMAFGDDLGSALKWALIFALVQGIWPAFATLVPSTELQSGSQELLLTNGQRPVPLWLGHFLAEVPVVLLATIPVAIIYGTAGTGHFYDIGYLWLTLFFAGLAGTAQSYWIVHLTPGPLAAFAVAAMWNVVALLIMIASILVAATFVVTDNILGVLHTIWWAEGILAPANSVLWAAFMSGNLFNLLCDGRAGFASANPGTINFFGGPIMYAIFWLLVCLMVTILLDYDVFDFPRLWLRRRHVSRAVHAADAEAAGRVVDPIVAAEEQRVLDPNNQDVVRVVHATVAYGPKMVAVDNVTLGFPESQTLALLGPNAAGKTTLHKLIRAEIRATAGNVYIKELDAHKQRTLARGLISSVPQNDGLDGPLTVKEHLMTYARIRGVPVKERNRNVHLAMKLCDLSIYADRAAGALSGGGKRRLMLAIALLGNPPLLMLDELSSGVDALTKRYLWSTLRRASVGRTVIMTTHSVEEVDALSDRLAIQAKRLLSVGSVTDIRRAFPWVEVQFAIDRTWTPPADDLQIVSPPVLSPDIKADIPPLPYLDVDSSGNAEHIISPSAKSKPLPRSLPMACLDGSDKQSTTSSTSHDAQHEYIWTHVVKPFFPHARPSDEASLRYEIPLSVGDGTNSTSIADVNRTLDNGATQLARAGISDYCVQPLAMESIFMRIVKDADVANE